MKFSPEVISIFKILIPALLAAFAAALATFISIGGGIGSFLSGLSERIPTPRIWSRRKLAKIRNAIYLQIARTMIQLLRPLPSSGVRFLQR
jgi:hypothetical protein